MRRGSIIVLFILIAGIAALLFFFHQGRKNILTDPYLAIPVDACFVLESVDLPALLNRMTEESSLFKELSNVNELNSFNRRLKFLSVLINRKEYGRIFEKNTSVISFHYSDEGKLVPLLAMGVPPEFRFRHIRGLITSTTAAKITEKKNHSEKIIEISYPFMSGRDTVYITFDSGLLICSSSEVLINNAVKQKKLDSDIRTLPGFSRIKSASGKRIDKIFLVFSNISKIIRAVTGGKAPGLAEEVSILAGSGEGDIYLNDGDFLLSGYMECPDSSSTLYRFKSYAPGSLDTYKVLPAVTFLFETIILPESVIGESLNSQMTDSTAKLAGLLKPYIGEEITRAFLDIKGDKETDNSLIIYELRNREATEGIFTDWLKKQTNSDLKKETKFVTWFQPDEQTKVPVYSTPSGRLLSFLVPGFAPDVPDSLFAFYDNFMITGDSYVAITRFLYDNMLNKTLANDLTYRDFEGTMPGRAGYFFYCVPAKIIEFLSDFLNDSIIKSLYSNINSLKKIQAAGYQFAASNGMIYNTLSVRYKEEIREESGAEWETLLESPACIKPFFFTNHNTGSKEVFIQDYKNNAYLVNSAGRVLWKVPLGERILSNVYMIDYYGNGKFQLLFSGRNNLHLLDRNGNYVDRYPVRLRSPASGPVALFNYDDNNDYRLIIPGDDKQIYAYDKSGSVVKGWKLFKTNGYVKSEIKYFRISGKDYLVATDESSVYFLDRTGSVRLKLKDPVTRAKGSEIRITGGSDPALVFSSPQGTLQMVSFDGTVSKTTLKIFSGDHTFDFFDIDGDGFGEYIFIDRGILYLYDHDNSEMFTRDFGTEDLAGPISFIFSAEDRKIGVFDNSKKLIYLIDKKGNTMNGFPLQGASMFSIGKFSEKSGFHLIVGGDNSFLYNYKLNTGSNVVQ
ncbi:MAG: hypothetical protein C0408_05190 [Odoribacter sp.]|nr:hypothetical protein [Odoribacter sp.]